MNYKDKQDWIEAVMASDLTPATKVYAFGIYKHMYGVKDNSYPGAKAITEATGLNDSQFYKYNQALQQAGFLEVTSGKGKGKGHSNATNVYRLTEPTSTEGNPSPSEEVTSPPERVRVTSTEGTNTTKNTTKDTSMEYNKNNNAPVVADAPTVPSFLNDEIKSVPDLPMSFKDEVDLFALNRKGAFYVVDFKFESANEVTSSEGNPGESQIETDTGWDRHEWDDRMPEDWFAIMRQRPLTKEEKEYREARARAYNRAKAEKQSVLVGGDDW
jgi:hypothetical protein